MQLFVPIIFFISFAGIMVITVSKIPVLAMLPERKFEWAGISHYYLNLQKQIQNSPLFKNFLTEAFLHKTLSKIRVFALRIEHTSATYLEHLRKKSHTEKINKERAGYWSNLKKTVKKG